MKVNTELRTGLEKMRSETSRAPQVGNRFGQMVLQHGERLHGEQITKLLGDISAAGDRLARSRNMRDLAKFKMLVRRFLSEAVEVGLDVKQSHTWNQFGEGRRLKIVQTIDEKLIALAEAILDEEKMSVEILDKIGEIKGLLINLYT